MMAELTICTDDLADKKEAYDDRNHESRSQADRDHRGLSTQTFR